MYGNFVWFSFWQMVLSPQSCIAIFKINRHMWLCIFMQSSEKWKSYISVYQGNVSISLCYLSFGHSDYSGCGSTLCMQIFFLLCIVNTQLFLQLFCIWRDQSKYCSFRQSYQERVWKWWKSWLHSWSSKIHSQNPSLALPHKLNKPYSS